MANIEAARVKATIEAPAKAGERNRVRSSMGRSWARSRTTNTTIRAAEPASSATIWVEPQPLSLPRTSANTSRNSEALKVTSPAQSMRVPSGSATPRTCVMVMNTASAPMGRLTKKIHPQPMPEVMTPPIRGPMATAMPTTAP